MHILQIYKDYFPVLGGIEVDERRDRHRAQQIVLVGEVVVRGGMTHARALGALAQAHLVGTVLQRQGAGGVEQRVAQIAVVVALGCLSRRI